jgi:hypothetical protein
MELDEELERTWILLFGRRPQAKDITDLRFFSALNTLEYPRPEGTRWTLVSEIQERLPFPRRVIIAKARTMIRKNRGLTGCYCGCRGDFELSRPLTIEQYIGLEIMRGLAEAMDRQLLYRAGGNANGIYLSGM